MTSHLKLIVGLANPGPDYGVTRHNAGAWYVSSLAGRYNQSLKLEKKFFGQMAKIQNNNEDILLLIPTTFMNLSGKAVAAVAKFWRISPEEILVAHDELDLPPGVARFKQGGGHGGHNGIRDIISQLGNTADFHRVRIGIGHPGESQRVASFVLSKPPASEKDRIDDAIIEALNCTEIWLQQDRLKAMNRLHSKTAESPGSSLSNK